MLGALKWGRVKRKAKFIILLFRKLAVYGKIGEITGRIIETAR
jgi:hypothetical protein